MTNDKIMTAEEAVSRFIRPGCHIGFGGFSYLRKPMTITREIVRQGIGDLFVSSNGLGLSEEMLAGCGLIGKLEATILGLPRPMSVAYALCRSVETGRIPFVEDYSNGSFALSTLAGRLGLPFMPCMTLFGSDVLKHDTFGEAGMRGLDEQGMPLVDGIPPKKFVTIDDPFDGYGLRPAGSDTTSNKTNFYRDGRHQSAMGADRGVKVGLIPPLMLDVAVVCAQRVSVGGIVRIDGLLAEDVDQSLCAKHLIVQCERICSEEELRTVPEHNQIPPHFVSAIVEQPFGGFPGCVPDYYDYDPDFIPDYAAAVSGMDLDEVCEWWHAHLAAENDWDYLTNKIGWKRLINCRAVPKYRFNPDIKPLGKEARR